MRQSFALLSFLALFSIWFPSQTAAQNNSATASPTPKPNTVVEIQDVSFDKKAYVQMCPTAYQESSCYEANSLAKVTVTAKNLSSETFYYAVSGGQIEGQGANVVWNLNNEAPGKYLITVGIGKDYIIHGKTITKTIELFPCDCCLIPCVCPTLKISGANKPAKPGDNVIFSAFVSGDKKLITYKWRISGGEIIAGQNTSQIMVKMNSDTLADKITATVEIGGTDPSCSCPNTDSFTIPIESQKP